MRKARRLFEKVPAEL